MVSAADIQRVITLRVGDIDPATGDPPVAGGAGMVASNISTLWEVHADKTSPRLRELYVQRDALDLIIALLRHQVDISQGDPLLSVKQSQRAQVAIQQREATLLEIKLIENAGVRVGRITTASPITLDDELNRPWSPIPDPNDYGGTAYPRVRRQ